MENQKVVIFDLDGCISDDAWRLPMIEKKIVGVDYPNGDKFVNDYDKYHSFLYKDSPLPIGKDRLLNWINLGFRPVFMTARPGKYFRATAAWLKLHFGLVEKEHYSIYMRDEDDTRPAPIVKEEFLARFQKSDPSATIHSAYDDREDVVDMFLANGVVAYILDKNGIRELIKDKDINRNAEPKTAYATIIDAHASDGYITGNVKINDPESFKKVQEAILNGRTSMKNEFIVNVPELRVKDGHITFTGEKFDQAESRMVRGGTTEPLKSKRNASDILGEAADTFRERNAIYGDNAFKVGEVMAVLFPNGVNPQTKEDHHMYHLFELLVVKLTRFSNSGLKHQDSIHDLMVYAAMCENLVDTHNINFAGKV